MAVKRITSIGLTTEQLQRIEAERARVKATTGIEPSLGAIIRATIDRGLSAADQKKAK